MKPNPTSNLKLNPKMCVVVRQMFLSISLPQKLTPSERKTQAFLRNREYERYF